MSERKRYSYDCMALSFAESTQDRAVARRRTAARSRVIGGSASPRSPEFFQKAPPVFKNLPEVYYAGIVKSPLISALPTGLGTVWGSDRVPVSASVSAPSIRPLADQRRPVPPGTNLGYLTHATTPPGRRTFAAGSSAPACAASASSGRAPRA